MEQVIKIPLDIYSILPKIPCSLFWSHNLNFILQCSQNTSVFHLYRRTVQVSQTTRWVSPIDFTDGDTTAPKLDGVTKHYQQDEGVFYPHTI